MMIALLVVLSIIAAFGFFGMMGLYRAWILVKEGINAPRWQLCFLSAIWIAIFEAHGALILWFCLGGGR